MNVEQQINRFKRRIILNSTINSIIYGLIGAFVFSTIITIILFLFNTKNIGITLLIFIFSLIVFSLICYFWRFRVTKKAMAKQIDSLGLDERVITMLEYQNDDSIFARLQREDAYKKLSEISVKQIKINIKKVTLVVLGITLVMFAASFTLPNPQIIEELPPVVTPEEPSKEDLIIIEMLEKVREIINNSEVEQEIKNKLHELVDKLEQDLKECNTISEKISLIRTVMKEIEEIIEYYLTERNLGQALQMYDPFTKKDFLTTVLGEAIYEKNLEGVDTSLEDFKQQILNSANKRSTEFEELRDEYVKNLEEALKRASLEDNEALIEAVTKFRDAMKTATPENIAEIIDTAKEDIKKALLEDPTGTKEDQAAEDMKEDISDAMQDAIDQLEKEESKEEDKIETEGESEGKEEENSPPVVPDNPLESEPIIDGNTPYLQEYEKYAEIINNLLSSYEGEEIPASVRKIIEEYLKLLK